MGEKPNKQHKKIVVLLVIVIAIGIVQLFLAGIDYKKSNEKERLAAERKKVDIENLYKHVRNEYEQLQDKAQWWTENMAKLTLNHTRDTIKHTPYTIAEFREYHRGIGNVLTMLKEEGLRSISYRPSEVQNLFSEEGELSVAMGFFKTREMLFEKMNDLNDAYYDISAQSKVTDSVKFRDRDSRIYYRHYFDTLKEMDQAFYDLLAYRYQESIQFLMHTYPSFVQEAKIRLLEKQVMAINNAHSSWKNHSTPLPRHMQILPHKGSGDTLEIMSGVFRNGAKTLIIAHIETKLYPYTDAERTALINELDAVAPKEKKEEKRYYYVWSADGTYYATDADKKLYPHVLEGDDKEVLQFYDDELKRYYVTGEYSAIDAFYPGGEK